MPNGIEGFLHVEGEGHGVKAFVPVVVNVLHEVDHLICHGLSLPEAALSDRCILVASIFSNTLPTQESRVTGWKSSTVEGEWFFGIGMVMPSFQLLGI